MTKPKMILFDYGQTLVREDKFDGVKGTAELMKYAKRNKYGRTPEQVQEAADTLNQELGRFDYAQGHKCQIEIPARTFEAYLYESQGIELSVSYEQAEVIFWNASSPGTATEGIGAFLTFLEEQDIRTGVVSNFSSGGQVLSERINRLIPEHHFSFIMTSMDYVFRKPNRHIFEVALEKSGFCAEEVWYIGDNYECDIKGAEGAGIFPVWYTAVLNFEQDLSKGKDILKIESWEELKALMYNII